MQNVANTGKKGDIVSVPVQRAVNMIEAKRAILSPPDQSLEAQ